MSDNQLGKNIQQLREVYGETLEKLGDSLGFSKSTIKGYENGSRKPDPDTLFAIAKHYGKTVDELLYTDLSELVQIQFENKSLAELMSLYNKIMPLYCSDESLMNDNFKQAYDHCLQLLDGFSKGSVLRGTLITDIFEEFFAAVKETERLEIYADLLWSIFLWWTQIFDTGAMMQLNNQLYSKEIDIKKFMTVMKSESEDVIKRKRSFINDFNPIIMDVIKSLKTDLDWSDLADYYLALRYVVDMVDSDYTAEMNRAIGIQLMVSLVEIENRFAYNFLKLTTEI